MSVLAAYLSVIFVWATTPLAIQWSGLEAGIIFGAGVRMAIAAVLCLSLLWVLGLRLSWQRAAIHTYIAIAIKISVGIPLVYWSAYFIPSGLISVMFGMSPLATSVFAALLLNERSLTTGKLSGIILGIIGLGIIFQAELTIDGKGLPGLLAILSAVMVFSFSAVWIKRSNANISPLVMTTGGLWIAVPLYGLAWILLSHPPLPELSPRAIAAIIYLGVFGSVLGFVFYYYILKHMETSKVAMITLITPVLALLLGQTINSEEPTPHIWLGSAIILFGLMFHVWGDSLLLRRQVTS